MMVIKKEEINNVAEFESMHLRGCECDRFPPESPKSINYQKVFKICEEDWWRQAHGEEVVNLGTFEIYNPCDLNYWFISSTPDGLGNFWIGDTIHIQTPLTLIDHLCFQFTPETMPEPTEPLSITAWLTSGFNKIDISIQRLNDYMLQPIGNSTDYNIGSGPLYLVCRP